MAATDHPHQLHHGSVLGCLCLHAGIRRFNDIDEAYPVDMLDNKGYVISYPEYLGLESFVMHDQNSAYDALLP